MDVDRQVLGILDEVLGLHGRGLTFSRESPLLGAIPELDSMAVVALISAMEEQFGFVFDDEDMTGATFASVGSLTDFISARLAG